MRPEKKLSLCSKPVVIWRKVESYKSQVGFSERTDAVIEPKLSMQWFCKMDEMAKPALEDVLKGDIKLIPEKFINTYRYWMENVQDWCISRQLWWGQQIPAWYGPKDIAWPNGEHFEIAKTKEEAESLFKQYYGSLDGAYSEATIATAIKKIKTGRRRSRYLVLLLVMAYISIRRV